MESTVADTQAVASAQGWEEELQELQRRHEFAEKMGGPEAIARQAVSAIDAVVHLERHRDLRRVAALGVLGIGGDGRLAMRTEG